MCLHVSTMMSQECVCREYTLWQVVIHALLEFSFHVKGIAVRYIPYNMHNSNKQCLILSILKLFLQKSEYFRIISQLLLNLTSVGKRVYSFRFSSCYILHSYSKVSS